MQARNFLAAVLALAAVLNLSGCVAGRGDGGYRYDHGDRIAADGRRDVGWCAVHTDDVHCKVEQR